MSNHTHIKYPLKPLKHFSLYWWSKHHILENFTVSFTLDVGSLHSCLLEAIMTLPEASGNPFSFSVCVSTGTDYHIKLWCASKPFLQPTDATQFQLLVLLNVIFYLIFKFFMSGSGMMAWCLGVLTAWW